MKLGHVDHDSGGSIGKNLLVENDITRDINTTRATVKAFVAFMHRAIP